MHYVAATIELSFPLQSAMFSVYVTKSLYLILILYPVIGEPLVVGVIHEMVIVLATWLILVVGATGASGYLAASSETD